MTITAAGFPLCHQHRVLTFHELPLTASCCCHFPASCCCYFPAFNREIQLLWSVCVCARTRACVHTCSFAGWLPSPALSALWAPKLHVVSSFPFPGIPCSEQECCRVRIKHLSTALRHWQGERSWMWRKGSYLPGGAKRPEPRELFSTHSPFSVFVCSFVCFCLLRATPVAYGGSQARGQSSYICQPTPQPQQHKIQATPETYITAHGNAGSLTH